MFYYSPEFRDFLKFLAYIPIHAIEGGPRNLRCEAAEVADMTSGGHDGLSVSVGPLMASISSGGEGTTNKVLLQSPPSLPRVPPSLRRCRRRGVGAFFPANWTSSWRGLLLDFAAGGRRGIHPWASAKLPGTLGIFYKRQPQNVTRVSLKFFKNLPGSVSKSVS